MKTLKYILILPIIIGLSVCSIQAQNFDISKEKVNLFTDRTLFVSGEEIHFAAFLENKNNQSKIIYIELILPDGTSLVSQKHAISNKQIKGKIEIPKGIISGTYYLKAYTRYMRNYGAKNFAYMPLKVINPFNWEFASGEDNLVLDILDKKEILTKQAIKIGVNYFELNISAQELQSLKNAFISLVPASSFQKNNFKTAKHSINTQKYFPETQGLSLSGLLLDSSSNKPLAYKKVTLSIIDQKNFMQTLTTSDGRFYFSLPEITGNHDLFISTKKEDGVNTLILVDKDFDTEQISLPNPPFTLSKAERETGLILAQSYQISKNYSIKNYEHRLDTFFIPFYGKGANTLYFDNYITFETLEEYFTELPGLVHIKNDKKNKYFTVSSPLRDMSIYPPLVLIDMVVVEDYNRILKVSPHGIEKVEIIPHPYVYGNFIYGGIISIRTRKGDFGGISLPKTGLFFNFDFLQPKSYYQKSNISNPSPSTNNTLFWNVYNINENTSIDLKFKKSPQFDNYWMIIQGINKEGEIIRKIYSVDLN